MTWLPNWLVLKTVSRSCFIINNLNKCDKPSIYFNLYLTLCYYLCWPPFSKSVVLSPSGYVFAILCWILALFTILLGLAFNFVLDSGMICKLTTWILTTPLGPVCYNCNNFII